MVLDTNIWVSAMVWGGSPASIIKAAEDNRIDIVVSEEIVREIGRTLAYPRLREVYECVNVKREELIEAVLRIAIIVEVKAEVDVIHEGSADNKFLECALDGNADYVVSGDEHLLRIKHYGRMQVISVRQFLKLLEEYERHSSSIG